MHICSGCFTQVSELWPVGLLFLFLPENGFDMSSKLSQLGKNKKKTIIYLSSAESATRGVNVESDPTEPRYALPLQTVKIQISWFLKPTDLDLHCLSFSMWNSINNLDQVIWLAEN